MSTGSEEYNCDFLTLQKYALSQEEKKELQTLPWE